MLCISQTHMPTHFLFDVDVECQYILKSHDFRWRFLMILSKFHIHNDASHVSASANFCKYLIHSSIDASS